jgi:hypothetical protein
MNKEKEKRNKSETRNRIKEIKKKETEKIIEGKYK